MSSFLVMKYLPLILSALGKKVVQVVISLDAQVALSWILTCNVKTKNVFAKNRVSDMKLMRKYIYTKYNIECKYRYIPTEINPADLVTRGVTISAEFRKQEIFWIYGSEFVLSEEILWPERPMKCLSESSKALLIDFIEKRKIFIIISKNIRITIIYYLSKKVPETSVRVPGRI